MVRIDMRHGSLALVLCSGGKRQVHGQRTGAERVSVQRVRQADRQGQARQDLRPRVPLAGQMEADRRDRWCRRPERSRRGSAAHIPHRAVPVTADAR